MQDGLRPVRCFITCCLLLVMLLAPIIAEAQQIAIIREGKVAPFSGVLYDDVAFAQQRAEQERREESFKNQLNKELKLQRINLQLATATTAAALEGERTRNAGVEKVLRDRVDALETNLAKEQEKPKGASTLEAVWYVGLGALAVLAGAAGIALVANASAP